MRPLRRAWRGLTVGLPARVSALRGRLRDPAATRSSRTAGPIGSDVAILAHYSPDGAVDAETLAFIDALRAAGRTVLFASNAGTLSRDAMAALGTRCPGVLVRDNAGHDFSAWRAAMLMWRLPRPDTQSLLLVNDSLHGPSTPLGPLLARMDFSAADIWALTDSRQRGWHLQSFFLLAGRTALTHPAWAAFWAGVRPVRSREWAIVAGELRFSAAMARAGLRLAAVWPYETVLTRFLADPPGSAAEAAHRRFVEAGVARGHALNPSIHLWRALLRLGFPFVKRDLTGRNRGGVADAGEYGVNLSR